MKINIPRALFYGCRAMTIIVHGGESGREKFME